MKTNRTVSLTSSPMGIKKHVPNFLTLCNLACGAIGIIVLSNMDGSFSWTLACSMVFLGAFFDFLDGFSARLLKVSNELGKQLDSMADMVTFGVLPGLIAYHLILAATFGIKGNDLMIERLLPYVAIIIPVLSGLRLAKFNLDTRQTSSFIGLPTPANAIFWASIPLMMTFGSETGFARVAQAVVSNPWIVACCALVLSVLLVSSLPMFALKFKNFGFADNKVRYIFIGLAILTIIGGLLIKNVFVSIPIILLLYLIISIVNNLISKGNEVQSGN